MILTFHIRQLNTSFISTYIHTYHIYLTLYVIIHWLYLSRLPNLSQNWNPSILTICLSPFCIIEVYMIIDIMKCNKKPLLFNNKLSNKGNSVNMLYADSKAPTEQSESRATLSADKSHYPVRSRLSHITWSSSSLKWGKSSDSYIDFAGRETQDQH